MGMEIAVGQVRAAPRRPTNASLDENLVCQARLLTSNLSGTVEDPLRELVTRERSRHAAEDEAVAAIVDGMNDFHRTHGLLSDEFSSF